MAEVKHSFTSPKADGPDATRVRPGDWNAAHALSADIVAAVAAAHARQHSIISTPDHTSAATNGQMLKANANGLPVDATNTDAQVSGAVAASHAKQHAITATADHTSGATAGRILKADANGLPVDASAGVTDAQLVRLLGDYDPIGCVIGDGVNVIAAGSKLFRPITHNCTVVAWVIFGDPSGSIVVDVKNGTYAAHPAKASIAGTELPTLTAQEKNADLALSTWTPALVAGDVLEFTWGAATTCKRVTVTLFVTRT